MTDKLLHITFAAQDAAWVDGVLLAGLGLAPDQYWTRAEDDLGALQLEELSRAVRGCRYTLLVVSGAGRVDQWAQFAAELAQRLGIDEGKPRLLLVLRDFAPDSDQARALLPLHQQSLTSFDCSDDARTPRALKALADQLALTVTEVPREACPYPGLRTFGGGDPAAFGRTDLFFGRDREAAQVRARLAASRRALVIGPSGCGKSSLIRARVLPALAVPHAIVRPGADPDRALRDALARLPGDGRAAVLFIDQLEEAFAAGATRAWFGRLGEAVARPGLQVIASVRSDFFDEVMRSPMWPMFEDNRIELAPLRGDGLRDAIVRPAAAVGVHVEVDLVERLVGEADQDRAAEALPLLQVVLERLWPYRAWRYLSLDSYDQLVGDAPEGRSGLDVVFGRHADDAVAALGAAAAPLVRRVLIDLIQLGEGRPDTRRRRTRHALERDGDDAAALDRVLAALSAQRLIVASAEGIDLAHDALITGWDTLVGWLAERRDRVVTQRRLEARATGGLLARSELGEFERWLAWVDSPAGRDLGATPALRALVERSVRARNRRYTAVVLFIAMLAVATGIALWQRDVATEELARNERLLGVSVAVAQNYVDVIPDTLVPGSMDPAKLQQQRHEAANALTTETLVLLGEGLSDRHDTTAYCLLVRMSYAVYALKTRLQEGNPLEALGTYELLARPSDARCGAIELVYEAFGNRALNAKHFAEATAYFARALAQIDDELAQAPDVLRTNILYRRAQDQLYLAALAQLQHDTVTARTRLEAAKQTIQQIAQRDDRLRPNPLQSYLDTIEAAVRQAEPAAPPR